MLRIVAYDISNPKRLRRVALACLDYGIRIEKSVFECDLRNDQFEELWEEQQTQDLPFVQMIYGNNGLRVMAVM